MFFIFSIQFDDEIKIVHQDGVSWRKHVSFGISKNVKKNFEKLIFFENLEKVKMSLKSSEKVAEDML